MAASGFGALGLKVNNLDFGCVRPKLRTWKPLHCLRTPKIVRFDDLVLSRRSKKPIDIRQRSASADDYNANVDNNSKETNSTDAASSLIPSASELRSLLTLLCDTTSIAEFELKLGGFQLYVSRDLADQGAPPHAPTSSPATTHSLVEIPGSNGSASSTSLAISKPTSSSLLDKASDEALALLKSPRVGYFRRSRTIKGKRAPPSCKEKDAVREGQVLCYIEQLGGEIPVESDISGEVVKILKVDGDPVGYGDALIAVLPSFPGGKKLQ